MMRALWMGLAAGLLWVELAAAQGQTPARAGDWWQRAPLFRTKYYTVKSDLDDKEMKVLSSHIDGTFESYMAMFSKLPVRLQRPARLNLCLFAEQDDYMKVLAAQFNSDATGSWGKCITRGSEIYLVGYRGKYSAEQMKPLLQHEGFHQVASHLFPGLPVWANEGLAELFERGVMVGNTLALGEFSKRDKNRLLEAIKEKRTLPCDRLFAIDGAQWSAKVQSKDAEELYLQAWGTIHFFLFTENHKYERGFLEFLVQLNRGVSWQKAFVAALGTPDFRAIDQKWEEYVRTIPTSDYRETAWRLEFLAAGLAKLHAQDVHPTSIDELKAKLQEARFAHESALFGQSRAMNAADNRLYSPAADEASKAEFLLVDARGRPVDPEHPSRDAKTANLATTGAEPVVFTAKAVTRSKQLEYALSSEPTKVAPKPAAGARK